MTKILKGTIVRLNVAKCFTTREGGELEFPLETYGNDRDGTVHSSRPITQDERNAWYDSPRSHGLNSAGETRLAPRSVTVMLHRDRTYTVLRARTAAQLSYGNKTGGLTKIFCSETGEETYVKTALIEVVPAPVEEAEVVEEVEVAEAEVDQYGNTKATAGFDRCECGCKYWEADHCVDCGNAFHADNLASDDWAEELVAEMEAARADKYESLSLPSKVMVKAFVATACDDCREGCCALDASAELVAELEGAKAKFEAEVASAMAAAEAEFVAAKARFEAAKKKAARRFLQSAGLR